MGDAETWALQPAGGDDSGVLAHGASDGVLAARPELTAEMAKKLLALVTGAMQDEIRRGGDPAAARDGALRGWGLAGTSELEDCLRRCSDHAPEDAFLRSWLSLYRELARVAEPLEVPAKASRKILMQARQHCVAPAPVVAREAWDRCD
mmetsp:Transcript_13759/g.27781  ORF Transcript_13759/g.27781 Transcript_13759/m.27781 type:complete len:149 (+) Transcript_13759:77-523(+)